MQKQFLLNTLLLIGAICLTARGVAHANEFNTPDNATHATTQATDPSKPQNDQQEAPVIHSNSAQEPSNVHTSTQGDQPAQYSQQDDSSEDMD